MSTVQPKSLQCGRAWPRRSAALSCADGNLLQPQRPVVRTAPCRPACSLDQRLIAHSPSRRLVKAYSSAAAGSSGFFDNKLPDSYEGAAKGGAAEGVAPQPAQQEVAENKPPPEKSAGRLKQLLTPLSDPVANRRLLALCFAQTLCSVATLIHDTYLPVYLQDVLGMSNQKIGNLQAIAQFLSNASKSLSGTIADIISPARMVIFGTLLTTLNKPMFAASGYVFATFGTTATLYWITAGKVFDRMSKGIREAPSKALIGELSQKSGDSPTAAFSLRQALGTFGALVGSAIAGLAFNLSGRNYILTFALSAIPAAVALLITTAAFGSKSAAAAEAKEKSKASAGAAEGETDQNNKLSIVDKAKSLAGALGPAYWEALAVVCLLYFARFDASFITLRAKTVMPKSQLPLLTSTMMLTQALLAAPAGLRAKSSLKSRNNVLLVGFAAMIGADLAFALIGSVPGMFLGATLVGVHMALTHGVSLAMVASYIPTTSVPGIGRVTGTCWSFTDFVFGIILAYSNSVAGKFADMTVQQGQGNIGCFFGGAGATILSGLALVIFARFFHLGKDEYVQQSKPSRK